MSYSIPVCTTFTELAGIQYPFLNAPIPGVATPALVAAVSESGGLGVIPGGSLFPDELVSFANEVKKLTDKPFAINLTIPWRFPTPEHAFDTFADAVTPLLTDLGLPDGSDSPMSESYDFSMKNRPSFQEQFAAALSVKPRAMISSSGGFAEEEADQLTDAGILNVGVVTSFREAKVMRAAGCDALIVQGVEASGPRLSFENPDTVQLGLMSLLPAAARATGLPVLAAGGIATAEQVDAVFALGGAGVVVGTALMPTQESGADETHRYYALYGKPEETVMSRVFTGRLSRVICNGLVEALADYEDKTAGYPGQWQIMKEIDRIARQQGRTDLMMISVGQSAGRSHYKTVAETIGSMFRVK